MSSQRMCLSMFVGVGLLISAAAANASDRPYLSSNEPDVELLLADRARFVQDIYQPSAADNAKIMDALRDLANPQEQYQRQAELTLSRLQLAISIVHHDTNISDDNKKLRIFKFQTQFHNILARAPLSLRHVIQVVEAMLPPEAASEGRARMTDKLQLQIKELGGMFDLERIDGIVYGPVTAGPRPEILLPDRQAPQPLTLSPQSVDRPAPLQPDSSSKQPGQTPPPPPPPPSAATKTPPPSATPKPAHASAPVPRAPPIADWKKQLHIATEKYGFNPAQMEAAQGVINQSIEFAERYRTNTKSAVNEAEAMPDSPEKIERLKSLNDPVDRAYDTMIKRIDALASIEQRNRAAAQSRE